MGFSTSYGDADWSRASRLWLNLNRLYSVKAAPMQSKPGPKFAVVGTVTVVVIKIVVVSDRSFHFLQYFCYRHCSQFSRSPGANTEAVGFHLLVLPLPSLGFCPFRHCELVYPVAHYYQPLPDTKRSHFSATSARAVGYSLAATGLVGQPQGKSPAYSSIKIPISRSNDQRAR